MSSIKADLRKKIPNRVTSHFDKYVQYVNPVPFDPVKDIYRQAFDDDQWEALEVLMSSRFGRRLLRRDTSFDMSYKGKSRRPRSPTPLVTFDFPDKKKRPDIIINLEHLPPESQEKVLPWLSKAKAYRSLRKELYARLVALLDVGWDEHRYWDGYRGTSRGGPEPGRACKTPGQVNAVWPEVMAFFPNDMIAKVRNAGARSRLPEYFVYRNQSLSPMQFMVESQLYHDDDRTKPYTEEEMSNARRRFEAINQILTQMSLLKEVPHDPNYPTFS